MLNWGMIIWGLILAVLVLAVALNFRKLAGVFAKLKVFFGEVSTEMQKVTWPTQEEVVNSTILVVVTTFALTIFLWVVDLVIGQAIRLVF